MQDQIEALKRDEGRAAARFYREMRTNGLPRWLAATAFVLWRVSYEFPRPSMYVEETEDLTEED